MKKIIGLLLIIIICSVSATLALANQVTIDIDGERIVFPDAVPILDENNRTIVPIRFISESLGYKVDWSQATWHTGERIIWLSNLTNSIQLEIGHNSVIVNGERVELDTSPVLITNRTYVPLRFIIEKFGANIDWQQTDYGIHVEINRQILEITNVQFAEDAYYQGQEIEAIVSIDNNGQAEQAIWLGYSLRDPHGKWLDVPARAITVPAISSIDVTMNYIAHNVLSGEHDVVFAIWDRNPSSLNAQRITDVHLSKYIKIYRARDDFTTFDEHFWKVTSGRMLGRTLFQKENVTVDDNKLLMKLPARTLAGAEIQSKELMSYGSYEIRMKLPDAACSITGFFLYKMPDYYHEIDIEVLNQVNGPVYFTTYANGAMHNTEEYDLDFDVTANYHNYRFDYYRDRVDFYVDDVLMKSWVQGFTTEPMYLMLNIWYPNWLDGTRISEDKYLSVDWIRF